VAIGGVHSRLRLGSVLNDGWQRLCILSFHGQTASAAAISATPFGAACHARRAFLDSFLYSGQTAVQTALRVTLGVDAVAGAQRDSPHRACQRLRRRRGCARHRPHPPRNCLQDMHSTAFSNRCSRHQRHSRSNSRLLSRECVHLVQFQITLITLRDASLEWMDAAGASSSAREWI